MNIDHARNSPDYGILESYIEDNKRGHNLTEDAFRVNHVNEIIKQSPEVWKAAKEDFEIYQNW